MAYNKKEILKQAVAAIKKHELTTIEEVLLYIPAERSIVFHEDWRSEFLDPLKVVLEDMKVQLKSKLRKNWRKSKSAILQIAVYKLMANEEEKVALNPPRVQPKKEEDDGEEITLNL